jgi:hypothetical protein
MFATRYAPYLTVLLLATACTPQIVYLTTDGQTTITADTSSSTSSSSTSPSTSSTLPTTTATSSTGEVASSTGGTASSGTGSAGMTTSTTGSTGTGGTGSGGQTPFECQSIPQEGEDWGPCGLDDHNQFLCEADGLCLATVTGMICIPKCEIGSVCPEFGCDGGTCNLGLGCALPCDSDAECPPGLLCDMANDAANPVCVWSVQPKFHCGVAAERCTAKSLDWCDEVDALCDTTVLNPSPGNEHPDYCIGARERCDEGMTPCDVCAYIALTCQELGGGTEPCNEKYAECLCLAKSHGLFI